MFLTDENLEKSHSVSGARVISRPVISRDCFDAFQARIFIRGTGVSEDVHVGPDALVISRGCRRRFGREVIDRFQYNEGR